MTNLEEKVKISQLEFNIICKALEISCEYLSDYEVTIDGDDLTDPVEIEYKLFEKAFLNLNKDKVNKVYETFMNTREILDSCEVVDDD